MMMNGLPGAMGREARSHPFGRQMQDLGEHAPRSAERALFELVGPTADNARCRFFPPTHGFESHTAPGGAASRLHTHCSSRGLARACSIEAIEGIASVASVGDALRHVLRSRAFKC